MLNSKSRANSNESLLVFSVGGHPETGITVEFCRVMVSRKWGWSHLHASRTDVRARKLVTRKFRCKKVSHQMQIAFQVQNPTKAGCHSKWSNLPSLPKKADWKLDTHRKMYGAQRKKDSAIEVSHRTGAKQRR